jgi:shikimate dehydrogenase
VLVYGTGATARSTIAALRELKIEKIYLTGRNTAAGNKLVSEFGVNFMPMNQLKDILFAGIIQTTSVGMYPNTIELPPLADFFRPGMLVFDVIFNPVKTRLLEEAEEAGCRIISGTEMYIRQALRQFELFSGKHTTLDMVEKIWKTL